MNNVPATNKKGAGGGGAKTKKTLDPLEVRTAIVYEKGDFYSLGGFFSCGQDLGICIETGLMGLGAGQQSFGCKDLAIGVRRINGRRGRESNMCASHLPSTAPKSI